MSTPLYQCSNEDSEMFIRRFWDRWAMGPSTRPGGPEGIPLGSGNLLGAYQYTWHSNPRGPIDVQTDIMVHHGGVQRAQAEDALLGDAKAVHASIDGLWQWLGFEPGSHPAGDPVNLAELQAAVQAIKAKLGA